MRSQLQVFLLPANFETDGMTSHKHGLAAKYIFKMAASEVASFQTNSVLRIADTSEAETSVSRKAECLLALGKDNKSKLFGVTFSFKDSTERRSFSIYILDQKMS